MDFAAVFEKLKESDKHYFSEIIMDYLQMQKIGIRDIEIDHIEGRGRQCPNCGERLGIKIGKNKGVQRYQCKSCKKYFSSSSGTVTYWLKKRDLLSKYISCFFEGKSIRYCANFVGISIQTSFDWRHKLLVAFQRVVADTRLNGICVSRLVEMNNSIKGLNVGATIQNGDQLEFRSKKLKKLPSIKVVVCSDTRGNIHMTQFGTSLPDFDQVKNEIISKIESETALTLDADPFLQKLFKLNVPKGFKKITASRRIFPDIANRDLKSFETWKCRFRGTSGKYLANYLNWFNVLSRNFDTVNYDYQLVWKSIQSNRTWGSFIDLKKISYIN